MFLWTRSHMSYGPGTVDLGIELICPRPGLICLWTRSHMSMDQDSNVHGPGLIHILRPKYICLRALTPCLETMQAIQIQDSKNKISFGIYI